MSIAIDKNLVEFGYEIPLSFNRPSWMRCDTCGVEKRLARIRYKRDTYLCQLCTMNTPERKIAASVASKANWQNKEYRDKLVSIFNDPEHIKMSVNIGKALHANPEFKSKYIAATTTEEFKAKHLAAMNTPELKEKMSDINKVLWANPEHKAKHLASVNAPEYIQKQSEIAKFLWATDEFRAKHTNVVNSSEYRDKYLAATTSPAYKATREKMFNSTEYKSRVAAGVARFAESGVRSQPEQHIANILDGLGVKYKSYSIGPYTFDFFCEDYKLLIEVQGDYWHTLPNHANRDVKKASYITNNFPKLKLLCIWEHQISFEDKVIEIIKYHTGLYKHDIVQYELCDLTIGEVDGKVADEFLDTWHYASHGRAGGKCYAAYLGEQVVTVFKFLPPTRQNIKQSINGAENPIELARMATHPRYQIKNLVSYCLSRIIKRLPDEYDVVISYADKTYGHYGAAYKASNFIMDKIVPVDYCYIDKNGWVCGKKKLYNHARAAHMKESEFAEKFEYVKSYGAEKTRWIYKR